MDATSQQLEVLYDGNCILCAAEINHYRSKDSHNQIRFTDISSEGFDAAALGLSAREVRTHMHARILSANQPARIVKGVDSFAAIWHTLGIWKPLQLLASHRLGKSLMHAGYAAFVIARPYLPKKVRNIRSGAYASCDGDQCEI